MNNKLIGLNGLTRDFYDWCVKEYGINGTVYNCIAVRDSFRDHVKRHIRTGFCYTLPSDRTIKMCLRDLKARGVFEQVSRGEYIVNKKNYIHQ